LTSLDEDARALEARALVVALENEWSMDAVRRMEEFADRSPEHMRCMEAVVCEENNLPIDFFTQMFGPAEDRMARDWLPKRSGEQHA
jgi:hypothetical protein